MKRRRVYDGFVKVDVVETPLGRREVVVATDSVAFLVYNKDKDEVLLTTQNRAPMITESNLTGRVTEVAAGRFDIKIGVRGLIKKELKEELGVTNIPDKSINVLNREIPLALSPGVLTERQHLAFVTVRQKQIDPRKRLYGAKGEGEQIERRFIPVRKLSQMVCEDMKTWALIQWFLRTRRKK